MFKSNINCITVDVSLFSLILHHHPCSHHWNSPPTTCIHCPGAPPLKSLIDNTSRNHSNMATSISTPPLSRGMWVAHSVFTQWRNWGGMTMRGDPRNRRPSQYVPKTNHNFYCGSFSLFPPTISPINISRLTVIAETQLHPTQSCQNLPQQNHHPHLSTYPCPTQSFERKKCKGGRSLLHLSALPLLDSLTSIKMWMVMVKWFSKGQHGSSSPSPLAIYVGLPPFTLTRKIRRYIMKMNHNVSHDLFLLSLSSHYHWQFRGPSILDVSTCTPLIPTLCWSSEQGTWRCQNRCQKLPLLNMHLPYPPSWTVWS